VSNPLYRALHASFDSASVCTQLPDVAATLNGIFEDNCTFGDGSTILSDSTIIGGAIPLYGGTYAEWPGTGPGRLFQIGHISTDSLAYRTLRLAGKKYTGNSSQYYSDSHLYNHAPSSVTTYTGAGADSAGFFSYSYHHGNFREFWAIPKTVEAYSGKESPTVAAQGQRSYVREQDANGRFGVYEQRQSYQNSDYGYRSIGKVRDRMFGLAYHYLNADSNAYGAWIPVDNAGTTPRSATCADSLQWWPAIGYDIGLPLNDSIYVYQSGTEHGGHGTGNAATDNPYNVYARYYSKALVLVKPNPGNGAAAEDSFVCADSIVYVGVRHNTPVTLPKALKVLGYGGTLSADSTTIHLRNVEAAILVDESGAMALPTPRLPGINPGGGQGATGIYYPAEYSHWQIGTAHQVVFAADTMPVDLVIYPATGWTGAYNPNMNTVSTDGAGRYSFSWTPAATLFAAGQPFDSTVCALPCQSSAIRLVYWTRPRGTVTTTNTVTSKDFTFSNVDSAVAPVLIPTAAGISAVPPGACNSGNYVYLSATVLDNSATGTVTFYDGATVIGTADLEIHGEIAITNTATIYLKSLAVGGGHNLTAVYAGDATHAGCTTSVMPYTINAPNITPGGSSKRNRPPIPPWLIPWLRLR
jgi:hypothetical protein